MEKEVEVEPKWKTSGKNVGGKGCAVGMGGGGGWSLKS